MAGVTSCVAAAASTAWCLYSPSKCPRMAWQSCIVPYLSKLQRLHNVHFTTITHLPKLHGNKYRAGLPWRECQHHMIRRTHGEGDAEPALENTLCSPEVIQLFETPGFYYLSWSDLRSNRYHVKLLPRPKFERLLKRTLFIMCCIYQPCLMHAVFFLGPCFESQSQRSQARHRGGVQCQNQQTRFSPEVREEADFLHACRILKLI